MNKVAKQVVTMGVAYDKLSSPNLVETGKYHFIKNVVNELDRAGVARSTMLLFPPASIRLI